MSRILVTVLSFNVLAAAHVSAQAQKPVVEVPIIADYYDVPTTLDGFAERADAAVIARVLQVKDAPSKGRAQTIYEMQVLQTLKEHREVGTTVQLCRPIGTVEQKDRIVKRFQPRFPGFEVGAEYLLFLSWDADATCFRNLYGAVSVGRFDTVGRLKAFTDHPALEVLQGLDKGQVAARVTAIRTKR